MDTVITEQINNKFSILVMRVEQLVIVKSAEKSLPKFA